MLVKVRDRLTDKVENLSVLKIVLNGLDRNVIDDHLAIACLFDTVMQTVGVSDSDLEKLTKEFGFDFISRVE